MNGSRGCQSGGGAGSVCGAERSGPWRLAFDTMLAGRSQIADPFRVVKLANQRFDQARRLAQRERLGIVATAAIRCIDRGGCSPRLMNVSTSGAPDGSSGTMSWRPSRSLLGGKSSRCLVSDLEPHGGLRSLSALMLGALATGVDLTTAKAVGSRGVFPSRGVVRND